MSCVHPYLTNASPSNPASLIAPTYVSDVLSLREVAPDEVEAALRQGFT